jgi:hypothetical protein
LVTRKVGVDIHIYIYIYIGALGWRCRGAGSVGGGTPGSLGGIAPEFRGGGPREAGRLGAATPGREKKEKFEPVGRRFENGQVPPAEKIGHNFWPSLYGDFDSPPSGPYKLGPPE